MKLSRRIENIEESPTVALDEKIRQMKKDGLTVYDFVAGVPEYGTPQEIVESAKKALDNGFTKYSDVSGLNELKVRIARENDVGQKNVMITNGGKEALYLAFLSVLNEGDEVIVLNPYWVSFNEQIKLAGASPVTVSVNDSYEPGLEDIAKSITENTRAIVINTPNNPTGAVYKRETIAGIAELSKRHNLWVISDEAYDFFVYDGEHFSVSGFAPENTIKVNSMSKKFAMTGWRIGYAVSGEEVVSAMSRLKSQISGNVHTYGQKGAAEAYEMDDKVLQDMYQDTRNKRDYIVDELKSRYEFSYPHGAFYLWAKVPNGFDSDLSFAEHMLEKNVAIMPGRAFGREDYFRLCYAGPWANLKKGVEILKRK
ncbi:MAG: pyridoxal phosphate-dependent aminotransferase [Candidatus Nanoarchaeia archaeon]